MPRISDLVWGLAERRVEVETEVWGVEAALGHAQPPPRGPLDGNFDAFKMRRSALLGDLVHLVLGSF